MDPLSEQILEIARSHADVARGAYASRDREVELLRGQLSVLQQALAQLRIDNITLRAKVKSLGDDKWRLADAIQHAIEDWFSEQDLLP